jgi:hypothetical protein
MFFFLGHDLEMIIDRVLIRADGPQLCAGTDFTGQRWLVFRSRSNQEQSLWLCSPITQRALRQVETGRATPRNALRHSATGSVEVVTYAGGRVLPERCLRCSDIPDALLPSADLRVTLFAECRQVAGADRSTAGPVASPAELPTLARQAGSRESHRPAGSHPDRRAA